MRAILNVHAGRIWPLIAGSHPWLGWITALQAYLDCWVSLLWDVKFCLECY